MSDPAGANATGWAPPKPGLTAWTAVGFLSVMYLVAYVDRLVLVVLAEPLKRDLTLTDTQIGLLVGTTFAIFYTFVTVPISRWADRVNRRNLIFFGAILWNLTTALSAFAQNFPTLLLLRMGVAIGEAVLTPAAMSLIADQFPRDRRALPVSIFIGVGAAGSSGSYIVAAAGLDLATTPFIQGLPMIGDLAAWRITLLLIGIAGALITLAFGALVREPVRPPIAAEGNATLRAALGHLRTNPLTYLGLIGAVSMMAMTTLSFKIWYPVSLVRNFGMDPASAGYTFGLIGTSTTLIGGLLIPNVANWIYRRGREDAMIWVALTLTLCCGPLLVAALFAPNATVSLALTTPALLLQVGMGIMMTTTLSLLPPPHLRAQVTAVYLLVTNLVGLGIGPVLVALLSDYVFPPPGGLIWSVVSIVCVLVPIQFVLLLIGRQPFGRTIKASADLEAAVRRGAP